MMAGMPAAYFCIKAFSETDMTEDLKNIDPASSSCTATTTRSCRWPPSAHLSVKPFLGSDTEGLSGAPHGMCTTEKDQVNADLLAFARAQESARMSGAA